MDGSRETDLMRATPHRMGYTWFLVTEVVDDLLHYPVSHLRGRPATAPKTQKPTALEPRPRLLDGAVRAGLHVSTGK